MTNPARLLRFEPIAPSPPDPYPNPTDKAERLLNVIYGPTKCTVCGVRPSEFVVVRVDGEWDGTSVCGGESPCAAWAVANYDHDDTEPWVEP